MCGIAGVVDLNGQNISQNILEKMTHSLIHRGPDGYGTFNENGIGFGHRRLSIIDISEAGKQPMISPDNKVILSYNGEIYNFLEIRKELLSLGYKFKSDSDTEVLLSAWHKWGANIVNRLNGMFAFSIFDRRDNSIYLVRDRYGIKPLYYGLWNNTLLFGSEQKAILEHPLASSSKEINLSALYEYMTFQNILTDNTLIKNIKLLPPGTIARLSLITKKIVFNKYWDYSFEEPLHKIDKNEYKEELNRLLDQAVKRQLVSDVEIGCYLSGGMDSGTVSSIASSVFKDIKTFTCGFDLSSASGIELSFDERRKAEAMSALFKTEHYEMVLKAGDMERCLPDLARHIEEPRVGQSYPNFYAAKLASKFVKVVLSGAGGDELFGGYPWRYYGPASSNSFDEYIDNYYLFWQRLISNSDLKNIFKPVWGQVEDVWTKDIFLDVFGSDHKNPSSPEDFINQSLYFECKTFLHGLLVIEDKLSMSQSLETRVPFLDNDLVEFSMKCPVNLKLNNLQQSMRIDENDPVKKTQKYFKKTNDGKQILRDVMSNYVPSEITEGVKQGFSAPDSSWFKGESIDFVRNKLIENDSILYNYLDKKSIVNLVEQHLKGKENKRLLIWSLINLDEYLNQLSL